MPASEPVTRLIDEAYAATIDPQRFERLIDLWGAHLYDSINANAPEALRDKVLEAHFARALEIAERLGVQRPDGQSMQAFIDDLPVAAFMIGRCKRILAANAAAAPLLPPGGRGSLADLMIDTTALARLEAWVSGRLTGVPCLFLPCYAGPEEAPGCIVATQLEPFSGEIGPHILVTTLDLRLDGETVEALCRAFSLSQAEAEVALMLAHGRSPREIAAIRAVSVNTVRTQIKLAMRKLSAKSIPDLVRILSGFSVSVAVSRNAGIGGLRTLPSDPLRRCGRIVLADGRTLEYEDYGARDGRPVLLIHNMLHSPLLTRGAIEAAARRNLRFIAPSRPGFGQSSPNRFVSGSHVPAAFARDALSLLDALGIGRTLVLGHLSGGVYGIHLANAAPGRVQGLLLASYVPAWSDRRMRHFPARQKLFALTSRYAPAMLPFIARAAANHIAAGGEDDLIHALHGSVPADMSALRRADVKEVVVHGFRHTVSQGAQGFVSDCPLVMTDWTAQAMGLAVPTRIVLGAHDWACRPEDARGFVRTVPRVSLTLVDDAGMYLLYTHWPRVFEHLEGLLAAGAGQGTRCRGGMDGPAPMPMHGGGTLGCRVGA
jgi:pimeloyl-ACP methyl ester carboxylesterase/DNA-binding CsgD family transcriptional regulator